MQHVKYLIKNYGSWNIFYIKYYGLSDFKLLRECVVLIVLGVSMQVNLQYVHLNVY